MEFLAGYEDADSSSSNTSFLSKKQEKEEVSTDDCSVQKKRRICNFDVGASPKVLECMAAVCSTVCPGEGKELEKRVLEAIRESEKIRKPLDKTTWILKETYMNANSWMLRRQILSIMSIDRTFAEVKEVHIQSQGTVPDHCRIYALTDGCTHCNHQHKDICEQCQNLEEVLGDVLLISKDSNWENKDAILFEVESAIDSIKNWKCHIMRARNQEDARLDLMSELQEGQVLVTFDWAMKFLPRKFREGQTDWFAKRGLNWHISVSVYKEDDEIKNTTHVHIFSNQVSQDAQVTLCLMKDTLADLQQLLRNVEEIHVFSDNAGCYKNNIIMTSLHQDLGQKLKTYNFSEAQDGKGPCDRRAANIKSVIKRYINEGHDVTSAVGMKQTSKVAPSLQAEYESFEKMISDGTDEFGHDTQPVSKDHYLIDGIVAYPGMPSLSNKQVDSIAIKDAATHSTASKDTAAHTTAKKDILTHTNIPKASSSDVSVTSDNSKHNNGQNVELNYNVSAAKTELPRDEKSHSSDEEEGTKEKEKATEVKKGRSLADDVMKLLGSSNLSQELDALPRPRSRSHSSSDSSRSSSSEGSRSVTPASSPDRKSEDRDDTAVVAKETGKSERDKDVKSSSRGRQESTSSVSSSKAEKSRSKRHGSRSRSKSPKHRRSRSPHSSRRKSRSSRERRKSKERKESSSHRKHSHSESHSRRHKKDRRSSRERRRRRSRDRKRRSRSRSPERRHKHGRRRHSSRSSHHRRHKRSHSRERSRSRSRSREKTRDRVDTERPSTSRKEEPDKHLTFKEKMRQQLLKASKYLQSGEGLEGLSMDGKTLDTPKEKPSNLPLNEKNFFAELASSTKSNVTPQVALLHTMAAMHQKAQEMTGVAVPKYYNPAAVNPLKYAEQVQKRKLLWSKAKDHKEDKEKEWGNSAFASDQSGKMAAKFRKLMGIKHEESGEGEEGPSAQGEMTDEQLQKQHELFSRLDKEYEFARMTTHTHRGVGLGFSSQGGFPNT